MNFIKDRLKMIDEAVKMGMPREEAERRRTGRSTGHALEAIGQALLNPETPVRLRDHFVPSPPGEFGALNTDDHSFRLAHSFVQELQLEGFHFNRHSMEIAFSLKDEPFSKWTTRRNRR